VKQNGFDPTEFEWAVLERDEYNTNSLGRGVQCKEFRVSVVLTHLQSGYYFIFGAYRVGFAPGQRTNESHQKHLGQWELKVKSFRIGFRNYERKW
jgi:hypothetical protein